MPKKRSVRKKRGHNKGFYFRKNRGWYATEGTRRIPLRYENGEHIKDEAADERDVREAHARYLLDKQKKPEVQNTTTVLQVCVAYLAEAKANGAKKTHADRSDTLYDFCYGVPSEYRQFSTFQEFRDGDQKFSETAREEAEKKRIHPGYGGIPAVDLTKLDIDQWLNAHQSWSGGRRSRIQAVKRALNYCVERSIIPANPIRGYFAPKPQGRVTYITPDQETVLLEHANPALATAIKVCLRTGARFGKEFIPLTKRHITDHGDRMEWKFKADEAKTGRLRIIRITDPEIIEITREHMKNTGQIFRSANGEPWTKKNLSQRFRFLKYKLEKQGTEFDPDCCMYSCRHTYAKRILEGYWTGKPTNIETLARLMGNSPQVCREHYLQWSVVDNEFLWQSA